MKIASVQDIEIYWKRYGDYVHDSIHVEDVSGYKEGDIFQSENKKYIIAYAVDNDAHFINPFFERSQYRIVRRIEYT
ncbi:MAG: hypothetical protein H7A23_04480 [Leptospiraceae bacterium]|nr:hypothetical protein [Leptospiraceae bacterium]MCP5493790.1 hypothetical protein [Leptospiraceae bacterium]